MAREDRSADHSTALELVEEVVKKCFETKDSLYLDSLRALENFISNATIGY